MKLGQIVLSFEALAGRLGLPAEHTIRAVLPPSDVDVASRSIRLLIEGPQMREMPEGAAVERRSLTIDGQGRAYFGES